MMRGFYILKKLTLSLNFSAIAANLPALTDISSAPPALDVVVNITIVPGEQ